MTKGQAIVLHILNFILFIIALVVYLLNPCGVTYIIQVLFLLLSGYVLGCITSTERIDEDD